MMTPDFHDGFVDGLLTLGSEARVFLRTLSGKRFTLVLHEVEAMHAHGFREGNIILSLDFLEPEQVGLEQVGEAYQYNEQHLQSIALGQWVENAKQRNLRVLEIAPSYGCSVLIFFKSHELTEEYTL
jgi:hypothetical protein